MTPYFEIRFVPFGQPLTDSLCAALANLLPDFQRVSAQHMRWRDGTASSVELYLDQSRLCDVVASVDLRMRPLTFIAELALIANQQGWECISGDGRLFRPSLRRFLQEIQP